MATESKKKATELFFDELVEQLGMPAMLEDDEPEMLFRWPTSIIRLGTTTPRPRRANGRFAKKA